MSISHAWNNIEQIATHNIVPPHLGYIVASTWVQAWLTCDPERLKEDASFEEHTKRLLIERVTKSRYKGIYKSRVDFMYNQILEGAINYYDALFQVGNQDS